MWPITVNGKTYRWNNISICNNKIIIDWKETEEWEDVKIFNINVTADLESLNVDACESINIKGNCKAVVSRNWNINIDWDVSLGVTNRNWDIKCWNVWWDVSNKNGNILHS